MTAAIFWASLGLLAYVTAGFPLLLLARARLFPRPYRMSGDEPDVTVVIAARNERDAIPSKIRNLLELDYPHDRFEVVVASDGSEDGTVEAVERAADGGAAPVRVLDLPRIGKAAALSAAVEAARGSILVFSDANSLFVRGALRTLVQPFADERIGGVAGNQVYEPNSSTRGTAVGERRYWDFDRMLKDAESAAGSVISATGAIYAIRRELYRPVPADVTDDFAISTAVIAAGRRLIFAPDAVALEPVAATGRDEFGRKVRIMTRGMRAIIARRELLNPFRHGFYSVQLLSHKVLRRLAVLPLVAIGVTAPLLWGDGVFFRVVTIVQALLYGAGVLGIVLSGSRLGSCRLLALPAFFCLANVAALRALWNVVSGRRLDRWEPVRHPDRSAASEARGGA